MSFRTTILIATMLAMPLHAAVAGDVAAKRAVSIAPQVEAKYIAVFCGEAGHEDGIPGYSEWLKGRLDRVERSFGAGDAVTLGVMNSMYCEYPMARAANQAVAKTGKQ